MTTTIVTTPWRDRDGAAQYMGISVGTVDRLVAEGVLRKWRMHGAPGVKRFHTDDLDALMKIMWANESTL